MTGRLVDALREIDPEVSPAEVADAVWLLDEVRRRTATRPPSAKGAAPREPDPALPPDRPPSPAAPPPVDRTSRPSPVPATTPSPTAERSVAPVAPVEPMAEWHLPRRGPDAEQADWLPARSPGADPLPAALAAGRALRPLHRRAPSRTDVVIDEEETARLAAEQDLLLPVRRPTPGRWLDLVLVIDASASMALWRAQVAGLRTLVEQLGAFRDIRTYHFDGDAAGERVVLRPGTHGHGGAGHDPAELVDPARRRAVLVVSDCVGEAWGSNGLDDVLQLWAKAGPVAVIQPLPQRLWAACRAELRPVSLRTARPGAANAELEVWSNEGSGGRALPIDGVPVPVLELDPRWLRPWAQLVADPGPEALPFMVLPVGSSKPGPDAMVALDASDDPEPETAEERLTLFRALASTDALELTQWLAAAPLTLRVMRLVQQSMMPHSSPSVLAEVFLGGLLVREADDGDGVTKSVTDPEDVAYEFVPGVRELLLDGMPRHEQLAVLDEVSRFIAQRLGSPNDFRAFISGEHPRALIARDAAFARVACRVLAGLGGRYGELASRLAPSAMPRSLN